MVPKSYIDEELSSLQNKVTHVIPPVAADADQVVRDLQNTIQMFVSNFAANSVLEVKEEKQMNKWFQDFLSPILWSYGYKISANFAENKYCIFGSSKPDINP